MTKLKFQSNIHDFHRVLGGYRPRGNKACLFCPAHHNTKTPALSVTINDIEKPLYNCKAGCSQEAVISALQALELVPKPDDFISSRPALSSQEVKELQAQRQALAKERKLQEHDEKERKQRTIQRILTSCDPTFSHKIELYLEQRGLAPFWGSLDVMQTQALFPFPQERQYWPAICSKIKRREKIIGIHTIFLDPKTWGKAPLRVQKKIFGSVSGGHIALVDNREDDKPISSYSWEVWICEGLETGIALQNWLDLPSSKNGCIVLVAINSSNLGKLDVSLYNPSTVVIAADNDANQAGQKAAQKAKQRYLSQGYPTAIKYPPVIGQDWLDSMVKIQTSETSK